jgi:hypothetical protein
MTTTVIIAYLLAHPIILIGLLGFLFNILRRFFVVSPTNAQTKTRQEMELQRRRLLEERARQQAALDDTEIFRRTAPKSLGMNDEDVDDDGLFTTGQPVVKSQTSNTPNQDQQTKDFQADILAALGMKPDSSSGGNPQETLRRQLAQKMGRNTPTVTQPSKAAQLTAQQQQIAAREAKNPTSRDAGGGITSSLKSEMVASSTNNIVDSNAGVSNSSIQVKLDRNTRVAASNSTNFGATNDVVRGIIWSEILGKPKSARR